MLLRHLRVSPAMGKVGWKRKSAAGVHPHPSMSPEMTHLIKRWERPARVLITSHGTFSIT